MNLCQVSPFSGAGICAINTGMELQGLYRQEELKIAQAQQKRTGRLMLAVAVLGLALCVGICCFVTRQNQRRTLPLVVGASILSGWVVIFLSHSRYEGAKAKVRHVELMLTGPRETFSGRFTLQPGIWRVKKGVSIRKVKEQEEFHETLLSVYDEKASRLPEDFTGTVETVYDCIVAFRAENGSGEVHPSEEVPA